MRRHHKLQLLPPMYQMSLAIFLHLGELNPESRQRICPVAFAYSFECGSSCCHGPAFTILCEFLVTFFFLNRGDSSFCEDLIYCCCCCSCNSIYVILLLLKQLELFVFLLGNLIRLIIIVVVAHSHRLREKKVIDLLLHGTHSCSFRESK